MTFPLTRKKYDVVVIGAGPAGSIAAKYAALGGVDVLFVDRKREIGAPIQCAGFTPDAEEIENLIPGFELPREMKRIPKNCILSKTTTQRLYSPDLKSKEFEVKGYVLDRRLFDADLAEQAANEGAELLCGTAVKSITSGAKEHTVKMSGVFGTLDVTAKVIIGADGPSSLVGKTFGLEHKETGQKNAENGNGAGFENPAEAGGEIEKAVGFEYKMTNVNIDSEALEMYFGNKYAPGGYIWIFPEGNGKANVGIGLRRSACTDKMSAREYLNKFIEEHPVASKKLAGGKVTSVLGGIIPVSGAPHRTATDSVMVAGDAAGHVMATNGGGIPFAAAAGKIAGNVAADAVFEDKCGRGLSVAYYENAWRDSFGDALDSSVQARKMMDKFMGSDRLLNAAFKLLPADKMKEMQCGGIPTPLKKGLNLLLK